MFSNEARKTDPQRDTQRQAEVMGKKKHKKARAEREKREARAVGEIKEEKLSSSGQNWAPRSN